MSLNPILLKASLLILSSDIGLTEIIGLIYFNREFKCLFAYK